MSTEPAAGAPHEHGHEPVQAAARRRRDRAVLAGLFMFAAALSLWTTQGFWFGNDEWDFFVRRSFADPGSWLLHHGGHWVAVQYAAMRGLYLAVGLDYWPWYQLPGLAALVALGLVVDWALRERGVHGPARFAAVALVLALRLRFQASHIGQLTLAVAIGVPAVVLSRRPESPRRLLALAAGLAGVMSGPVAVIALASTFVAVLFAPRLRGWWWAVGTPVAAYAAWHLGWLRLGGGASQTAALRLDTGDLTAFVTDTMGLWGLSGLPAAVAGAAGIALLTWVLVRRRLDRLGLLLAVVTALLALATVLLRPGHDYRRFGNLVTILLVPALVPVARSARGRVTTAGLCLALTVVVLWQKTTAPDVLGSLRRSAFEASAALYQAGEPAVQSLPYVDYSLFGPFLTNDAMRVLLADGYRSARPPPDGELARARGAMRVRVWPAGRAHGRPLGPVACTRLESGDPRAFTVGSEGVVELWATPESLIDWRWVDRYGVGVGRLPGAMLAHRGLEGHAALHLAAPAGRTSLTLTNRGERPARVCNVAEPP